MSPKTLLKENTTHIKKDHDIIEYSDISSLPKGKQRMYAVVFDLKTEKLEEHYEGDSHNNAYAKIRNFLISKGFTWQQGSTYFGSSDVTAVECVLIIQELSSNFDWFSKCVKDIRMLRIEENNDLMPAVERGSKT